MTCSQIACHNCRHHTYWYTPGGYQEPADEGEECQYDYPRYDHLHDYMVEGAYSESDVNGMVARQCPEYSHACPLLLHLEEQDRIAQRRAESERILANVRTLYGFTLS